MAGAGRAQMMSAEVMRHRRTCRRSCHRGPHLDVWMCCSDFGRDLLFIIERGVLVLGHLYALIGSVWRKPAHEQSAATTCNNDLPTPAEQKDEMDACKFAYTLWPPTSECLHSFHKRLNSHSSSLPYVKSTPLSNPPPIPAATLVASVNISSQQFLYRRHLVLKPLHLVRASAHADVALDPHDAVGVQQRMTLPDQGEAGLPRSLNGGSRRMHAVLQPGFLQ